MAPEPAFQQGRGEAAGRPGQGDVLVTAALMNDGDFVLVAVPPVGLGGDVPDFEGEDKSGLLAEAFFESLAQMAARFTIEH